MRLTELRIGTNIRITNILIRRIRYSVGCIILLSLVQQSLWSQQVIEKELTDWEFRMVGDSVWKKAKVPGTIIDNFVDLSDISNPDHPYYGDNEKLYQWIGKEDWEFRTIVYLEPRFWNWEYDLEFGSLDLFADIFVNGEKYTNSNAFYPVEIFNITSDYRYSDGALGKSIEIYILFHSTIDSLQKLQAQDSLKLPGGERVYGRTAQYQFGWDWGPKFVNMGIRKPVKLKFNESGPATINHLRFNQWKKGKKNILSIFLDGESRLNKLDWYFTIYLNGDSVDGWVASDWHGNLDGAYVHYMENPALWYPNENGKKSNYYEFDIKLKPPGDTTTLAHKHVYYAYCDIDLIQKKDKQGESFYFTVNGEKVFAKGANYVPDDSFHPGKNTIALVNLAADANMNMLRVWGGGIYPDHDFYIQCMKRGVMVWQDYMFACAMYPGDESFIYAVEEEARVQTERLEPYDNIATWCGNNENEEGWKNWGWQKEFKYTAEDSTKIWRDYLKLNDTILRFPGRYYRLMPDYISTSPKHGWGRKESMTEGDSHYWGVWWGLEPIEKYNEKIPRFMSEFGMQGMPDLSTLQKVIPDSAMNFNSPQFKNHQKHPTGFETLNHYLKEYLVIPDNMEDYAYATQILQAYALTTAIEAQRRAMPYCMGSLIWQLNDCWPVTSWSLVDYELKEKIAYHEIQKSFERYALSMKEDSSEYEIYIVNDNKKNRKVDFTFEIKDFYGQLLWRKRIVKSVSPNKSQMILKLNKKFLGEFNLRKIYLKCIFEGHSFSGDYLYGSKDLYFVRLKDLQLPKSDYVFTKERDRMLVTSHVYAPYTYFPKLDSEKDLYIGALEPGYTLYMEIPSNFNEIYSNNEARKKYIKCLNDLLNH